MDRAAAMDLHRIKCFIAVAEELHFGRAADRVHLTQPAVSLQVRSLEEELGVRLFFRTNRRVSITDVGALFLKQAYDLIRHSEAIVRDIKELNSRQPSKLIIGATSPSIYCLAPALVSKLNSMFPSMNVQVLPMSTEEQEEALIVGKIHVGLVHPPMSESNIRLLPIGSARFMFAIRRGHVLAVPGPMRLSELRGERILMFPRSVSPWIYDKIMGACLAAGFVAQVSMQATPAQTIIGLVAAGQGIGFVIAPFTSFGYGDVVYREIEDEAFELDFAFAKTPGLPDAISDALDVITASGELRAHLHIDAPETGKKKPAGSRVKK
jgi:DNA-binding transcriptional LysR family regulator